MTYWSEAGRPNQPDCLWVSTAHAQAPGALCFFSRRKIKNRTMKRRGVVFVLVLVLLLLLLGVRGQGEHEARGRILLRIMLLLGGLELRLSTEQLYKY